MVFEGPACEAASGMVARVKQSVAAIFVREGVWLSGVPVRFGEGYYILSAAHGIELIRDFRAVRVLTAGQPIASRQVAPERGVIGGALFSGGAYDVGLLKLAADFAATLGVTWVTEDQMDSSIALGRHAYVLGLPTFRAIGVGSSDLPTILRPIGLFTRILDGDPPSAVRDIVVEGVDLLAPLPDHDEDGAPLKEYDPRVLCGISGAGVFLFPAPRPSGLWSTSDALLAGIQVSVFRDSRLLRIQRIEHMLDCLRDADRGNLPA